MSERGVFAVDRGIWDHPLLQSKERFSRREAWIWLLSAATWKERTVFVDGKRVALKRGQLAHSIRFLADAWDWPKSKVARFLDALKTDTMIGTESGTGITIITICNYDKYQRVSLPYRDTDGPQSGTLAGHERDKEEDKENRKDKERGSLRSLDDWPSDFRDRFWSHYPRKAGKAAAIRKLETVRKSGAVTFANLMAGVERYARAAASIEPQFVKHPATWLNAGCWDDDPAALNRSTGPPGAAPSMSFHEIAAQLRGHHETHATGFDAEPAERPAGDGQLDFSARLR